MTKFWDKIKNIEELVVYFPDLKEHELPERELMLTVVSSIKPKAVRNLILEAQRSREKDCEEKDEDFVEIDPLIFEKIKDSVSIKNKN